MPAALEQKVGATSGSLPVFVKFHQHTAMLMVHVFSMVVFVLQQQSCHGDHMTSKPEIFIAWPFQKNFANIWVE